MDMGDMDMGDMACMASMSMLWNWNTINSCFLTSGWLIKTEVQFAFSVIGVFLISASIEGVKRAAREYDRRLQKAKLQEIEKLQAAKSLSYKDSPTIVQEPAKKSCCSSKKAFDESPSIEEVLPVLDNKSAGGCCKSKKVEPEEPVAKPTKSCCKSKDVSETSSDNDEIVPTPATSCCKSKASASNVNSEEVLLPPPVAPVKKACDCDDTGRPFSTMQANEKTGKAYIPLQFMDLSPSSAQQAIRAFLHFSHATPAFLVMLLGMYFNGYILLAVFIGSTIGNILCGSDTLYRDTQSSESGNCC